MTDIKQKTILRYLLNVILIIFKALYLFVNFILTGKNT